MRVVKRIPDRIQQVMDSAVVLLPPGCVRCVQSAEILEFRGVACRALGADPSGSSICVGSILEESAGTTAKHFRGALEQSTQRGSVGGLDQLSKLDILHWALG